MTRKGTYLLAAFLLLLSTKPAHSQYMYLDANGDGLSSLQDRLNEASPTTVDIWLDTRHHKDGSQATCATGEPLSVNSYECILHAEGGTVAWASFINHQTTMTVSFGESSDWTDFYSGRGGGAILNPGLYKLASITVTVLSGQPRLTLASETGLSSVFGTSFGSLCSGSENDNTLRLGTDWFDTNGLEPPEHPPTIIAPSSLQAFVGSDVSIQVDATDLLAQTAPLIKASGYPPGLTLSVSQIGTNASRGILSGYLGISDAGNHSIVWTANGENGQSTDSTVMAVSSQQQAAGATIVGYTTTGANVLVSEGANGINARLGIWGSAWPWAFCQQEVGYPCTDVENGLQVQIDVQSGAFLSFDFEFMQYGTPFLPDDLQITIGDGTTVVAPVWNHGNPQSCWGSLWQSPRRSIKVDLSQWPNRNVFLNIWVRDCLGHQSDALAIIHSIAIRECFVAPLAPLSAEDQAIFESNPDTPVESSLTTEMRAALTCLRSAVASAGGDSLVVRSAYRTQSYQSHLYELYMKWKKLEPDVRTIECQDLRTELRDHIHYHKMENLERPPAADAGLHPKGLAFDANWYGIDNIDALACFCGLYRPFKVTDKRHFILKPCQ